MAPRGASCARVSTATQGGLVSALPALVAGWVFPTSSVVRASFRLHGGERDRYGEWRGVRRSRRFGSCRYRHATTPRQRVEEFTRHSVRDLNPCYRRERALGRITLTQNSAL